MATYPDPVGDEWRYTTHRGHDDASEMITMIPVSYLLTEGGAAPSRLRVDPGSTGFFAGKEFRFFYEFDIPNGESRWVKVDVNVDSTLKLQTMTVDTGGVRARAWRGATEVGPFASPASPTSGWFNRNPSAQANYGYVGQNEVFIGGNLAVNIVGGTVSEVNRLLTAGATAQRISVGGSLTQERGISAGIYHIQLENVASSGSSTGVYDFVLEERSP